MISEVTNAVPADLFDKVSMIVSSDIFPWYYISNSAISSIEGTEEYNDEVSGAFAHTAILNGIKVTEYADDLSLCLTSILDSLNMKIKHLHRIRIGMMTISPRFRINTPHIDILKKHKVGLLYLNDSDGETFLYKEKFPPIYSVSGDPKDVVTYYEQWLNKQVTVMNKIKPEKNKFIMFDGLHYHSSSTPVTTKRRIVVNYVFETYD